MSIELETVDKLIDQKAYDDAISKAKEFLDKGEGIAEELEFAIIRALALKNRIAEAVARLVLLTQKNPLQETYFHFLGDMFMRMELWDKAFEAYGNAIELNPQQASFFGSLAECCRARKDTDAAFAAYERALQLAEEFSGSKLWEQSPQPFAAGSESLILSLESKGNARDLCFWGISENKTVGVYIPVGDQAKKPTEDILKDPNYPLFAFLESETKTVSREMLKRSLSLENVSKLDLFDTSVFEYTIYHKDGV